MTRPLRARRGMTIVEMLVVLVLSGIFGVLIANMFSVALHASTAVTQRMLTQQQSRTLLAEFSRTLHGARPLGTCLDSGSAAATPLSSCTRLGELPFSLEAASSNSISFYAYASSAVDPTSADRTVLRPPDRIVMSVDDDLNAAGGSVPTLRVRRYPPNQGMTYTDCTPATNCWSSTPDRVQTVGVLPNTYTGALLRFWDGNGTELLPTDGGQLPTAALAKAALVEISPAFSVPGGTSFATDLFVALNGSRYAREGTWSGS
jgi:prepilin-type N-terminal cleavage/methylation domain-containing protein